MWCLFHFCAYLLLCFAFHCMAGSFRRKQSCTLSSAKWTSSFLFPYFAADHTQIAVDRRQEHRQSMQVWLPYCGILRHTVAAKLFFGQSSSCHSLAFPLVSCQGLRAPSGLSMHIWPTLWSLLVVWLLFGCCLFLGWMRHECWWPEWFQTKPETNLTLESQVDLLLATFQPPK